MKPDPHLLVKNGKAISYRPRFKNVDHFLESQARRFGDKAALIFDAFGTQDPIRISYRELDRLTRNLAALLLEDWQLKSGDRFSFAFTNTPEVILLNYAAWRAGLVTIPLDVRRDTPDRKLYKLKFTQSKLLFTRADANTRKENAEIKKSLPRLKIIEIGNYEKFVKIVKLSTLRSTLYALRSRLDRDCLILFTSGTTAKPKGVRLSLKSLFANAESIADWLQYNEQERFHILLPLHHINSVTFTNTTLLVGGTIILSPRYSKSNFWKTMGKHQATGASIVPTIAYDLLSEKNSFVAYRRKLKQIRRIQIGSAPVQPKVVEEFMQEYKIPLIQGYGQTETSLRSTGVPMDLTPTQYAHIRKVNSIGTELEYTNVTILDEEGRERKEGKLGEICVRGPIIMKGYLKNPKANQEAFAHEWFHSGDTGYWKELYGRKFFFLKGRTKEIIKKGADLISPLAIENTLLENYPDLEKVYAVGFPDRRLGQEIGIVAIAKNQKVLEKILADAREKKITNLTYFESPQATLRIDESELPKTSTGKIQRLKIKEMFGPKLLENFRTIAKTRTHRFRSIGPEETALLKSAARINNIRWGKNLKSSLREFTARAKNGLLIGALHKSGNLVGTVSAIRVNEADLDKIGSKNHWANTWNGVTGSGTLTTHFHKGNSLVCVAISTEPTSMTSASKSEAHAKQTREKLPTLTQASLKEYLKGSTDPIIRFHRKPKAGLKTGAKITKIIPRGRPKDKDALGYNLLMKYPSLLRKPKVNPESSIGVQLIEAALLLAFSNKVKSVYAYTRPALLRKHFTTSTSSASSPPAQNP